MYQVLRRLFHLRPAQVALWAAVLLVAVFASSRFRAPGRSADSPSGGRAVAQEPSRDLAPLLDALSKARDALRRAERHACASCGSVETGQAAAAEADAILTDAATMLDSPAAGELLAIWQIRSGHASDTLAGTEDTQAAVDAIAAARDATADPLVGAATSWHLADLHHTLRDEVAVDDDLAAMTTAIGQVQTAGGLSDGVQAWTDALAAEVRVRRVFRLARQVTSEGLPPDPVYALAEDDPIAVAVADIALGSEDPAGVVRNIGLTAEQLRTFFRLTLVVNHDTPEHFDRQTIRSIAHYACKELRYHELPDADAHELGYLASRVSAARDKPLAAAILAVAIDRNRQSATPDTALHAELTIRRAKYCYGLGQTQTAEDLCTELAAQGARPEERVKGRFHLARFLRWEGRVEEATAQLESTIAEALPLGLNVSTARVELGRLYLNKQRYGEAVDELAAALSDTTFPPARARTLFWLVRALRFSGAEAQAADAYQQLSELAGSRSGTSGTAYMQWLADAAGKERNR